MVRLRVLPRHGNTTLESAQDERADSTFAEWLVALNLGQYTIIQQCIFCGM